MAFEDQGSMDFKQHINLSGKAWNIVENDMLDFYGDRERRLSGFLNRVFENFYPLASSSITLALEKKREKYAKILGKIPGVESSGGLKSGIITKFLEHEEEVLKKKAGSYPKGEGRKFRLSKNNMRYLSDHDSDCGEDYYYHQKTGRYLKAVFEEYARLPYYKREQIFFADNLLTAKTAIKTGKCLKITIQNDSAPAARYTMRPCRIMEDPHSSYTYLAGYSSRSDDGPGAESRPASFRVSRIREIRLMKGQSGRITEKEKRELDQMILKKGVPFLLGDIKSVKIRLSEAGEKAYRRQLHLRPVYDDILEGGVYVFHCSERQIINYFIKFGKDALILEPSGLKKLFQKFYSDSYQAYG
jgi:hypothetical protein